MNYENQLRKVIRCGSFRHRGCEVKLTGMGYEVLGAYCPDKAAVDKVIDEHIKTLQASINRIKPSCLRVVK